MSAFLCGPDNFKVLAIFAASRRRGGDWRVDPRYIKGLDPKGLYNLRGIHNLNVNELATLYADTLYQENIRSVRTRYPDDTWDSLPGPIVKPLHIIVTCADELNPVYRRFKPVSILKAVNCVDYQSCETEDWAQTVAYRLLDNIKSAAIRELPGYEEAPWDFYADEVAA